MKHELIGECMNQFCPQIHTQLYPSQFSSQTIFFCNNCQLLYEKKFCCYFCAQVYSDDNQNFLDGKQWIQCDIPNCDKWIHLECEKLYGILEIEYYIEDQSYKYKCPWCRQQFSKRNNFKANKIKKNKLKERQITQSQQIKLTQELIKYQENNQRKNSTTVNLDSAQTINDQTTFQFEPKMLKNCYFDDLLKKYGGFCQMATQSDVQNDINRLKDALNLK